MKRASKLITFSHYSRDEIAANTPIPPERVEVLYLGVPDPFGPLPEDGEREPMALTVGHLVKTTLMHKGHQPFVEAAHHLPDVRFVFVGKWHDDAIEHLRGLAPGNVEFTGWLADEELEALYRRASVYVQASRHEGFGLAVAEAMLAGCIPVVMDVTAMPEVVGDAGVLIASQDPAAVAEGVREALALGPEARERARDRILTEFPMENRREGILRACARRSRRARDSLRPLKRARLSGHRASDRRCPSPPRPRPLRPESRPRSPRPSRRALARVSAGGCDAACAGSGGCARRCCSTSARSCTSCIARTGASRSCSRPRRPS